MNEPREVKTIEIRTAVYLAGVLLAVAATFFATRQGLQGQLDTIKASQVATDEFNRYLRAGQVQAQVNSLLELESSLRRVRGFVTSWQDPHFEYGRNLPDATPFPNPIVIGPDGVSYGSIPASQVLFNMPEQLRATLSKELMDDVLDVFKSVSEYNRAVSDAAGFGAVGVGTLKVYAEIFVGRASEPITALRVKLAHLPERVAEERQGLESRLAKMGSPTTDH